MPMQSLAAVKRAKFIVGVVVGALLLGGIIVLITRVFQASALAAATELHAKQYVTTIAPKVGSGGLPLTLPGTLQGINEATVYARTNGYILRWTKDIGSSVKKGELMAEIATPEIDQELSQAVAAQQQAASSEGLAKSTADRWKSLREKDAVTQQDLDERQSTYIQAQASLASAEANTSRLRNLQSFNKVVAPFDGVVTSRNIDVGDLVDAGNGGVGKALFTIAQIDPLRLYVFVPQAYAQQVRVGDEVTVSMAAHQGEDYKGTIARTARAIDTGTRTMQVEIRVPNPHDALIAGAYVQVTLPIKQDGTALLVPTNVLLFRPDGPRVATVDDAGHVRLSTVKLGTDFGSTVAVLGGLKADDRVVLNPADSLADGDIVTLR
ncbi:MAG TPA: efflux RND transporter periplasmic adaptor subunit [Steroidobacteraceae bacterium]|jgi:RND family efflux transporter MFP subunit|nr:efflux RND transporter periplasmic adaptor subunit [Steroidobacteraceae bacterium]